MQLHPEISSGRLLRVSKNRCGPAPCYGLVYHTEAGLITADEYESTVEPRDDDPEPDAAESTTKWGHDIAVAEDVVLPVAMAGD